MRTTAERRIWALVAGTLGILCVISVGVWLRMNGDGPTAIDVAWHDFSLAEANSSLAAIANIFAAIGSSLGVIACGAIIISVLAIQRRYRDIAFVGTALLVGVACSQLLKTIIERPRPSDALLNLHDYSYPSGHSMGAAALAWGLVFVLCRRPRSRSFVITVCTLACLWTFAMMWSRTALGVHWLTDTLAGAVLGVSAVLIAWTVWHKTEENRVPEVFDTAASR